MKNEDKFNFWLPIDLVEKAKRNLNKDDDSRYDNMIFEGLASDDSVDWEGEVMEPNGFILDYFLENGLINLDHLPSRAEKNKSAYWIGEPLDGWVKDNKFYVKGKLWKKSPEARAFWDKCIQMEESGSTRKPGMSIEGKVLERDKNNRRRVKKGLVTNLALTFEPVNSNSFFDIVKGRQATDFVDYSFNDEKTFDDCVDNVIVQWVDRDGNKFELNDKLKLKIAVRPKYRVSNLETIYKNYKNGRISEGVYIDIIKNIAENFHIVK